MRIAIVSDIHSNVAALKAGLADAERRGADEVLVAGDVIGDGPRPREVIALLSRQGILTVRGNLDRKIARLPHDPRKLNQLLKKKKRKNKVWTALQLDRDHRAWIDSLPETLQLERQGIRIDLVHASPRQDEDPIYPSITREALHFKLDRRAPDVLVCGHTHVPFVKRVAGILVINCGTVGLPIDGDPRPTYALLQIDSEGRTRAAIHRFRYDNRLVADDIVKLGVPDVDPSVYLPLGE